MKPTFLLGFSVGALLVPVALWQSKPVNKAPLVPASTPARAVQSITKLPVLIDSPGRYVLSGSMTAGERPPRGFEAGIVIHADHVELDLDGYVLKGAEGTTSGIIVKLPEHRAELRDICVRNGTLTNWGSSGVDLGLVEGARLLDLHVSYNGAPGTTAAGLRGGVAATVRGCTAIGNTGPGIIAGERSVVGDCLSDLNGLEGFVLGGLATARRCSATKNGRDGYLLSGGGCSLVDCSAGSNTGNGINAALTAHVRACSAAGNGAAGVAVGRGSLVTECTAIGNGGAGVFADSGLCRVEGNHLVLNGSGFYVAGSGNVVARNTVSDPEGGVSLLSGSGPGGVFLADPASLRLSIAGFGSLKTKADLAEPEVIKDGGLLAPWANIVVK